MAKTITVQQHEQEDYILIMDRGARDLLASALKFAGEVTREHPTLAEEMGGKEIAGRVGALMVQVHDLLMDAKPSTHISVEFGQQK